MQKNRVFGLMTAAGCALFAASAMGAASNVVSNDFESVEANSQISLQEGWTGYGTVTNGNPGYANTVGYPTALGHTKVLAVEGRVTCSNTTMTASKPTTVDMMVQVALPDDGLAFPSGTPTEDIQIAVGVDTNAVPDKGELKVYCKDKSNPGVVGWYSLGAVLDKDTWHRVSFTFDYANDLCQIRVDGEPMMTANGYLTTDTSNLSTTNGSWYKLASSSTKLVSVQVIGSTSIDDLLVKQDTAEGATVNDVLPVLADAGGSTGGVPNSWIEEQGITRGTTTAPDGSGMTVAQKYRTGMSVADGQVFAITDMTMSGTKARLTVPVATANVGHNTIQYSTDISNDSNWTDAVSDASGTVEVDLDPTGAGAAAPAVIYVRLVNE